jgi:hypothetical protein
VEWDDWKLWFSGYLAQRSDLHYSWHRAEMLSMIDAIW